MDIGAILNNALGGLIGGLALWLLLAVGKRIRTKLRQRTVQPENVLNEALLKSQEYQEILEVRKFHRVIGCMFLFWLLALCVTAFILYLTTGNISVHFDWVIFLLLLLCAIPLEFYIGYSPISSREVEQRRQQSRERTFKEARGAIPYELILQRIIFPILFWLYLIVCIVGLVLLIASPSPLHLPLFWASLSIGLAIAAGLFCTYAVGREIYYAIRNLRYIQHERQSQLRQQFLQDEFK